MHPNLTRTIDEWIMTFAAVNQPAAAIEAIVEAAKNDIITLYQALPAQAVHDYRSYEARFLAAWKRGVIALRRPNLFGKEVGGGFESPTTIYRIQAAETKWDLRPHLDRIQATFGGLSAGEKKLLAGMVSFYNAEVGAELCRRAELDCPQKFAAGSDDVIRLVLAELTLYYPGW